MNVAQIIISYDFIQSNKLDKRISIPPLFVCFDPLSSLFVDLNSINLQMKSAPHENSLSYVFIEVVHKKRISNLENLKIVYYI